MTSPSCYASNELQVVRAIQLIDDGTIYAAKLREVLSEYGTTSMYANLSTIWYQIESLPTYHDTDVLTTAREVNREFDSLLSDLEFMFGYKRQRNNAKSNFNTGNSSSASVVKSSSANSSTSTVATNTAKPQNTSKAPNKDDAVGAALDQFLRCSLKAKSSGDSSELSKFAQRLLASIDEAITAKSHDRTQLSKYLVCIENNLREAFDLDEETQASIKARIQSLRLRLTQIEAVVEKKKSVTADSQMSLKEAEKLFTDTQRDLNSAELKVRETSSILHEYGPIEAFYDTLRELCKHVDTILLSCVERVITLPDGSSKLELVRKIDGVAQEFSGVCKCLPVEIVDISSFTCLTSVNRMLVNELNEG